MKDALISVIVPIYNSEEYLPLCVDSIINQTYCNLEIILVDDGSKDSSGKICNDYAEQDKRVIVIHKENGGMSSARNAGLDIAHGSLISFVDSDDYILKDYLKNLYSTMLNTNVDMVRCLFTRFSNIKPVQECTEEENIIVYNNSQWFQLFFKVKTNTSYHSSWSCLFKKDLIGDIRFQNGYFGEDLLFNYQVCKNMRTIALSNKREYCYFYREGSIIRSPFSRKDLFIVYAWETVLNDSELPKEYYKYVQRNLYKAKLDLLCKIAYYGMNDEDCLRDAKKNYLKEIRKHYFTLLTFRGMELYRKILLTSMCFSFNLTEWLIKKFHSFVTKVVKRHR